MNKFKRVENLVVDWNAINRKHKREFCKKGEHTSEGVVKGLNMALDIFQEPPNTQMQIDKETMCPKCKDWQKLEVFTYCPDCGKSLYD